MIRREEYYNLNREKIQDRESKYSSQCERILQRKKNDYCCI